MDEFETRTVMTMRTGTKICVLIGLAFVVLAVYFFFVPITSVRTTTGSVFGCGTALSPSHGDFADGVCGRLADVNKDKAIASLAVGLLTAIAGAAMFGVDRREERRPITRERRSFEDEHDDRRPTGRDRRDFDDDLDDRRPTGRDRRDFDDDLDDRRPTSRDRFDNDRDEQRSSRQTDDLAEHEPPTEQLSRRSARYHDDSRDR